LFCFVGNGTELFIADKALVQLIDGLKRGNDMYRFLIFIEQASIRKQKL
jgi:hypothetical protein